LLDPSTSDGRVVFFLPWEKMTVAGTTDSASEITHSPAPSDQDVQFILGEIKHYLSSDINGTRCLVTSDTASSVDCSSPWRCLVGVVWFAAIGARSEQERH
jgi:hypothetical protein